jgi:hypothetical protein
MYSDGIRAGNHPLVAYMRKAGKQEAHPEYQDHSGYCTEHEIETGRGPADCLDADKCWVIELKPNNNSAVNKGKDQAKKYADALNEDRDGKFSALGEKNKSFEKCKGVFEPKVTTYIFCPDVDDDGNYISTSYGWGDPQ